MIRGSDYRLKNKQVVNNMFRIAFMIFLGGNVLMAQKSDIVYPRMEFAELPLFPHDARCGIQGEVRLFLKTNGKSVSEIKIESGHPILAKAAVANIKSWKFRSHKPIEFVSVFKYYLSEESYCDARPDELSIKLPVEVTIRAMRVKECDPIDPKR